MLRPDADGFEMTVPSASRRAGTVPMPYPVRLMLAIASGLAVAFAFQPYAIWPLAFLGVAGLTVAAHGLRPRRGFAVGYLFGLAMLAVAIIWVRVIVGGGGVALLGIVALIAFEALFFGLLGVVISLVGRLRFWPPMAAAAWIGAEYLYSRYPFGGFGWTRTAYTQVDTPLAGLLPFIGVAGLSFVTPLLAQCLAWIPITLLAARRRAPASVGDDLHASAESGASQPPSSTPRLPRTFVLRTVLPALATWMILIGSGLALGGWNPAPADGTGQVAHVGIVQGNVPGKGIDALGRMRTVTANHVAETEKLMTAVRQGKDPEPDFILWPENSTDIDPTVDAITRNQVQTAATISGKPILVGAVMDGPGVDERQTSGLWWDPERGILARYDKRNLVPFGEWIPYRKELLPHFPILKLVGAQSVPGKKPGALTVPLSLGGGKQQQVTVGDAICFELAYDDTIYDVVNAGSELFMVQSNNATYTGTGQVEQQFAITRARAMETRREIAVATTNGVSGFIGRDGQVEWKTTERTAASTVVRMPLRTEITPAVHIAPWLERGIAVGALICCVVAVIASRRQSRTRS